MSYFAEIEKGIVRRVIVADQDFIDSGAVGVPSNWIETFVDGSQKKNFAAVGHTYDLQKDAFIPPKFAESWILNEETARWEAPIEYPKDGKVYVWDEEITNWKERIK